MNKVILNILVASLFGLLLFIGCDKAVDAEDIDKVVIPEKNVSYGKYIHPVLNLKCATSGCHNDESRAAGYSVNTWSSTRTPGIVNPGDVQTSTLVWVIEGTVAGRNMPPFGYPPLNQNQINGIKQWILEGALNN